MNVRRRAIAGLILVLLALAGCGSSGPAVQARRAGAVGGNAMPPPGLCPTGLSHLKSQRLPTGFEPVAVYQCTQDDETLAGQGQWLVDVEKRATRDLGPLVAALRQPDQPPPKDGICPADVEFLAPIVLQNQAGTLVRPAIPTGDCGQPQAGVVQAVDNLPWVTISHHPVRQVETQGELASGCPSGYKDEFDLDASVLQPGPAGRPLNGEPTSLTVCVFRDNPATNHPDGPTGPGSDTPVGAFVGGGKVTGSDEIALLDGISGGRASARCSVTHPEFAVISDAAGEYTQVEVGGCDRVFKMTVLNNKTQDLIGQATPQAEAIIAHVIHSNG